VADHAPTDLLRHAYARAARRPAFLASALVAYQELHGISEDALAEFLQCRADDLPRLGLCRRPPQTTGPAFRDAVHQIAAYADVDAARLAQLLRDVDTAAALQAAASRPAADQGLLMAARDRLDAEPAHDDRRRADDEESPP
jgi:hypothetical protein